MKFRLVKLVSSVCSVGVRWFSVVVVVVVGFSVCRVVWLLVKVLWFVLGGSGCRFRLMLMMMLWCLFGKGMVLMRMLLSLVLFRKRLLGYLSWMWLLAGFSMLVMV